MNAQRCSFYADNHVAVNKTWCSTHDRHPVTCAEALQKERDRYREALEYIEKTYRLRGATNELAYVKVKEILNDS